MQYMYGLTQDFDAISICRKALKMIICTSTRNRVRTHLSNLTCSQGLKLRVTVRELCYSLSFFFFAGQIIDQYLVFNISFKLALWDSTAYNFMAMVKTCKNTQFVQVSNVTFATRWLNYCLLLKLQ